MSSTVKNLPRVLVLLAAYNGLPWIRAQVKSIQNQIGVDVDIFIQDDLSSDNTYEYLVSIFGSDKRISLNQSAQSSGSAGSNFRDIFSSINISAFDFVALSDQDDLWMNNKLVRAINAIEHYQAAGYSSAVISFWKNHRCKLVYQNDKVRHTDFLFEGAGQGCTFVIPVNWFKLIQNFCILNKSLLDRFYYHDWLIYLLVRCWGGRWFFDKNPSVFYRQHEGNDTGSRGTFRSVLMRLRKIKNGWYKQQVGIAIEIYRSINAEYNSDINKFFSFFYFKDSIVRRYQMSKFLAKNGRRRLTDRGILILAALMGCL